MSNSGQRLASKKKIWGSFDMPSEYVDSISYDDRVLTVFRMLLRLYISSQTRTRPLRNWSLQQLAIEFEIEQAARLADTPHTVSSLAATLGLSVKVVSKTTARLVESGVILKRPSTDDGRVYFLVPTDAYYANGGDGMLKGISAVLTEAFGPQWRNLKIQENFDWFPSPDLYSEATPEIRRFRKQFAEKPVELTTED